jgi:hypothetical protein
METKLTSEQETVINSLKAALTTGKEIFIEGASGTGKKCTTREAIQAFLDNSRIDFDKLEIADHDFDRDGNCDVYSAVLEYSGQGNQEETDRFQYEIMKRAGIDVHLRNAGIEAGTFKRFRQLREDEDIQLKISLSYTLYGAFSEGLVAQAHYGTNDTPFSDVPLLDATEQGRLDAFYDRVLSEDKANLAAQYENDRTVGFGE